MDAAARHWYLQQMGIPVWLPKEAVELQAKALSEAAVNEPAVVGSSDVIEAPGTPNTAEQAGVSPAQALAASLRNAAEGEAVASPVAVPKQTESQPNQLADAAADSPVMQKSFWLVMPEVAEADQAAASELIAKILAAVSVPAEYCELIWGMPTQLPPASVKQLWCFGLPAPAGVSANCLNLPSVSEMLSNVDAKRQAWGQLKAAMPF